jgi:hypothetical protein
MNDVVAKATTALAKSVASIINCDEDEVTKRAALAETFTEFQTYLDRHVGGDIVEKAGGGAHDLVGALLRHLNDRLEHKREAHGFGKREYLMNRIQQLRDIAKGGGILAIAKTLVSENRSYGITEEEFVQFATEDAVRKFPDAKTPAAAFSQSFTAADADGLTLRRAHRIVRDEQFGTTAKADRSTGTAYNELQAKAAELRKARPELSEAQAFERVYSDRSNIELCKRERQESASR